jgi:hypothetical protein
MMRATVRWDPQGERYHQLIARVRKFDPKIFIGVCSKTEIARLEKLAADFEEQAEAGNSNQPSHQSSVVLDGLRSRYHQARNEVLRWQVDLKADKQALEIIGIPADLYVEPDPIPNEMPWFKSPEERETFNATFSHQVADIELKAQKLREYAQQWARLTLEQQNRRLILALAERFK